MTYLISHYAVLISQELSVTLTHSVSIAKTQPAVQDQSARMMQTVCTDSVATGSV